MMRYPKIQTLWKRDPDDKFKIIPGDYSKEEFPNIKNWVITEKIHGMNIRVIYEGDDFNPDMGHVSFGGKKKKSEIPVFLNDRLKEMFTADLLNYEFQSPEEAILFGEGYGGRIQKVGKLYREDCDFILFDVYLRSHGRGWWLTRDDVVDIAEKLGIEVVDQLDITTIEEAIELVKEAPYSKAADEDLVMEGVVARSDPLMLFRDETPVMWKLKVEDYRAIGEIE